MLASHQADLGMSRPLSLVLFPLVLIINEWTVIIIVFYLEPGFRSVAQFAITFTEVVTLPSYFFHDILATPPPTSAGYLISRDTCPTLSGYKGIPVKMSNMMKSYVTLNGLDMYTVKQRHLHVWLYGHFREKGKVHAKRRCTISEKKNTNHRTECEKVKHDQKLRKTQTEDWPIHCNNRDIFLIRLSYAKFDLIFSNRVCRHRLNFSTINGTLIVLTN